MLAFLLFACTSLPAETQSGPVVQPLSPLGTNMDFAEGERYWGGRGDGYKHFVDGGAAVLERIAWSDAQTFGTWSRCVDAKALDGARLTLSAQVNGWVARGRAGLWMRVDGPDGSLAFDNMSDRPLMGAIDGKQQVSLRLSDQAQRVCFGLLLRGIGRISMDDVELKAIELAPPSAEQLGAGDPLAPLTPRKLDNLVASARLWGTIQWDTAAGPLLAERFDDLMLQGLVAVEQAQDDAALVDALRAQVGPGTVVDLAPPSAPPAQQQSLADGVVYLVPGPGQAMPEGEEGIVLDLRGGAILSQAQAADLLAEKVSMSWAHFRRLGFQEGLGHNSVYRTTIEERKTEQRPTRHRSKAVEVVALTDERTRPSAAGALRALVEAGQARLLGSPLFPGLEPDIQVELLNGRVFALIPNVLGTVMPAYPLAEGADPIDQALALLADPAPPPPPTGEFPPELDWWNIDWRPVRLGAAIHIEQAMEHSWPYQDIVPVDWDATLREALGAVAEAGDPAAVKVALEPIFVHAGDGHGRIMLDGAPRKPYTPDLVLAWVEDQVVVATVADLAPGAEPGMVLSQIDGQPVDTVLSNALSHQSGATLASRRYRAVEDLLRREQPGRVQLAMAHPGQAPVDLSLPLLPTTGSAVPLSDLPERPEVDHLDDGVIYVDLDRVKGETLTAALPDLRAASGVVLDLRGYPRAPIDTIAKLLPKRVDSQRFDTPVWIGPGGPASWVEGGWRAGPRLMGFDVPTVVITDARAVSAAETVLSLFRDAGVPIVGQPSAGTNGNVTRGRAPGGVQFVFTGMRTTNHDGSRHHGIGVLPTVPVARTIAGVRAGQDEALDAALELLRKTQGG
ncbi:MAG: hypothetical protein GXP62_11305 [Oligoflexia bacterium]|nr:hypothetical protein [Oligoflexia bacterium]